jgi:hypothetical protein
MIQGLRMVKRMEMNEVLKHVGNGVQIAALTVKVMHLSLLSGLALEVNKIYFLFHHFVTKNS